MQHFPCVDRACRLTEFWVLHGSSQQVVMLIVVLRSLLLVDAFAKQKTMRWCARRWEASRSTFMLYFECCANSSAG